MLSDEFLKPSQSPEELRLERRHRRAVYLVVALWVAICLLIVLGKTP